MEISYPRQAGRTMDLLSCARDRSKHKEPDEETTSTVHPSATRRNPPALRTANGKHKRFRFATI